MFGIIKSGALHLRLLVHEESLDLQIKTVIHAFLQTATLRIFPTRKINFTANHFHAISTGTDICSYSRISPNDVCKRRTS